jgi:hypothetical protein
MQRSFFALLTLCSVPQEPIGLDIVTSKTWENKNSKHTSNSLAPGRQRFHAPLRVCLVPALYQSTRANRFSGMKLVTWEKWYPWPCYQQISGKAAKTSCITAYSPCGNSAWNYESQQIRPHKVATWSRDPGQRLVIILAVRCSCLEYSHWLSVVTRLPLLRPANPDDASNIYAITADASFRYSPWACQQLSARCHSIRSDCPYSLQFIITSGIYAYHGRTRLPAKLDCRRTPWFH